MRIPLHRLHEDNITTSELVDAINQILDEMKYPITSKELKEELLIRFGKQVHTQRISHLLANKMRNMIDRERVKSNKTLWVYWKKGKKLES